MPPAAAEGLPTVPMPDQRDVSRVSCCCCWQEVVGEVACGASQMHQSSTIWCCVVNVARWYHKATLITSPWKSPPIYTLSLFVITNIHENEYLRAVHA